MNRPEPIELENNLGPDAVTGEINRVPWMAYDVDEMDIYIAEKDAAIAELKNKLDDAQAKVYADSIDAWKRERRLRRALWLARAVCAQESQYWGAYVRYVHLHENSFYEFINDDIFRRDNPNNGSFRTWNHRWQSVERKCLAKARKYK